jgi:hypothetical protein
VILTGGEKLQKAYEDAVAGQPREAFPLELEAWLDGLDDGTLAFVANRALREEPLVVGGRKTFHRWRTRDAAIMALLHWESRVTDSREDTLAWAFLRRCMTTSFMYLADTWPAADDNGMPPDTE